jgi:uncharacterized protein (TIGR02145 family)
MKRNFLILVSIIVSISFNAIAQGQNNINKYSPDGKWLLKTEADNSPGSVTLFVPQFISNCEPSLLEANSLLKNNSLFYSRSKIYKELFLELLLQTTAQENVYAAEVSKKISGTITMGKMGIKLLGELDVIDKSSIIYKELPYQLKLVSMVFSVDYKVQQAAIEAAALYAALSAFSEARYFALQNALNYSKYSDQAMNIGLNDAYNEIKQLKEKDLQTLKSNISTNSSVTEISSGLVNMATGGLFGNLISTLAGSGLVSASLASALPTAWFWQLGRTFNAEKSAASIVLLSTIDKAVLAKVPNPFTNADNYILYQLRSHLSFMILNAANSYKLNNSCQSNFEGATNKWIEGWPYYDFAELALLKQKALNELEIKLPPNSLIEKTTVPSESGTFTDDRDGHVYKWVKIGEQIWMAENLAYKTTVGSWAYDFNQTNISKYGYLYDWETAKKICPTGWHLPSDNDWETLVNFAGGKSYAAVKLKEKGTAHWQEYDDIVGTNETGFTALPGGSRFYIHFMYGGSTGFWWSSTEEDQYGVWYRSITNGYNSVSRSSYSNGSAVSVRCIKD